MCDLSFPIYDYSPKCGVYEVCVEICSLSILTFMQKDIVPQVRQRIRARNNFSFFPVRSSTTQMEDGLLPRYEGGKAEIKSNR